MRLAEMLKKLFIISAIVIFGLLSAQEKTKESDEENTKENISEKITQKSLESIFDSTLTCNKKFNTGEFQRCHLEVFHNKKPLKDAKVFLYGGMPSHSHGLPTAPKVIWSHSENNYEIKGLKFSMPGEWILHFNVHLEADKLKDKISMSIKVE